MAEQIGGSIVWNLDVDANKFNKGLSDAANKAEDTGRRFRSMAESAVVPLGIGFAGVAGVMVGAVKAFSDAENVTAQLDAVLKSTGGAAGVTRDQVLDLSSALQQQSKFDDEAITGAQNMLLTFTSISKDVFPEATRTALNMSQALGQDLKSSSIQLGKALNDPINGVTALRRVGVQFTDSQQDQIKTLVESGNKLEAQRLILKELGTEFGGSALASSKTFAGQMEIMKNNVNDLSETIGGGLLEALNMLPGGIQGVNTFLVNLNNFLKEHKEVLVGVTFALIAVAATLGVLFVTALVVTAGAAGVWVIAIGAMVAAVAFVAGVVVTRWEQFKQSIVNIFNGLIGFFWSIRNVIFDAIVGPWWDVLKTIIDIANRIRKAANEVNPFVRHSPSLVENVQKGIGIIKDQYKSLGDISIPPINHQYTPALINGSMMAGGSNTTKTQNINVSIGQIKDRNDIDSLIRELGYRSNL